MDIGTFCEEVVKCIREVLDEDAKIKVHKMYKNNGICLHSIVITYGDQRCVPNIYMDEYYHKYKMGVMSLGQIACEVMKERDILGHQMIELLGEMTWENAKDKVFCRLVNLEMNKKKLENMPYMEYLDLAVTCRLLHSVDKTGIASADITYGEMELFGVTKEELFMQARENTEKLFPVEFKSLLSVIEKLMRKKFGFEGTDTEKMDCEITGRFEMYVLSNTSGINGAGVILYPSVLKKIAEQLNTDTLYLLPSSLHEFIVLKEYRSIEDMKSLVMDANRCAVAGMDLLSDNVYKYDRATDRVEIVE